MEMGTGKTKTAVDEVGEALVEDHVEQLLVLAPNGVISNWPKREIPAHMPDAVLDRTRMHLWQGGNTKREQNEINTLYNETDRYGVLAMNLEAVSASDRGWKLALEYCKKRPTAVIIDESTRIKSPDTIITETAMRLRDLSPMRRILTGYPNPNSPMDLYSQMEFTQKECLGTNFYSFKHKYAITKDMQVGWKKNARGTLVPRMTKLIVGFQRQEELADRLARHSYRALKKDCLDLPPENYNVRDVQMTDEQWRIYRDLVNQCTAEIDASEFVTATLIITQMLRLHQVVCGFVKLDDGRERPIKSNRIKAMQEHVEEWCGRPGIIWCTYQFNIREVVETMTKMYGAHKVVQYHGGINDDDCDLAIDRFQGGDADYFVATEQKGGFGITLTRGADDLFFSNTYNLEHRLQAEARNHRSGQLNSVNHGDLRTLGTVDEKIFVKLREKLDISSAVLRDGYKQWVI